MRFFLALKIVLVLLLVLEISADDEDEEEDENGIFRFTKIRKEFAKFGQARPMMLWSHLSGRKTEPIMNAT
jgi:hypothetical protein